jgi:2-polyprenyl-3-methyl-5-hydroxy-6-metoxy-1,4-benzoquinol methylase
MDIRRVAIIYDDTVRPETTGGYCRRALEQLVEVTHFLPLDGLATIPRSGFDLYLNIDDGFEYAFPSDLRPSAFWAIDTHLNYPRCREKATQFDCVFAAQKDGAEQLARDGSPAAFWLPLAFDPGIHRKHVVAKTHDVCFVGNLFPDRVDLLHRIRRKYHNTFVGQRYFDEMAKTFSESRIVFNKSIRNDVNMRVFEAVGCGSLLLTNDLAENGLGELLKDGKHLATYRDADELLDKVAYYLARETVREQIAAAGLAEALARHTYKHRMEQLLKSVAEQTSIVTVPVGIPPSRQLAQRNHQDAFYFEHARPEVLALVPANARRVLDVGCGAGRLGEALLARQPAEVVGIELCPDAAELARKRLDDVIVGDIERLADNTVSGLFDAIICADVLEHLRDPARFLRRAKAWLRPGGALVASVPNVRNISVVKALLGGHWTYESAGLLDETHLNFFTRRDLVDLFEGAGFRVDRMEGVPGPGFDDWQAQGAPTELQVGALRISGLPVDEVLDFFVYQYLLVANPVAEPKLGDGNNDRAQTSRPREHATTERSQVFGRTAARGRPAMRFTQEFVKDFEQIDLWGRPFAFARFGDGERSICRGVPVACSDGWSFNGGSSTFASDLYASLISDFPDYYVGISDTCCDREAHEWFMKRVRVPLDRLTFANILVNGNYQRFRATDLRGTVVVASEGGDFTVPEDIAGTGFEIDGLVERLLRVDRPILVAAGPAACVIVHRYWQRADAEKRQSIMDVGSAIDEFTKRRKTRRYHFPGSPTANRICRW